MAIDPSISLNAKAPAMGVRLGELANTAYNVLQLKKAAATLDSDIARNKATTKTTEAGAKVAEANVNPLIAEQAARTGAAQTAQQSAAFDLTNRQHQQTVSTITGLLGDESVRKGDPRGINAALDMAEQNAIHYGSPPEEVRAAIEPFRQMAATNPGAVQPALVNLLRQGLGVSGQAAVAQPSGPTVDTGAATYQVNTNPLAATPPGTVVPGTAAIKQLPPTTTVFNPQTQAPQYLGATGTQSGPQAGPGLGVPEQIQENQREIAAVRQAGDQVPVQRNINHEILGLSRDTASGPGTATWHNILGAASLGRFGDNYQELGKYLEKNAIANMSAMGGSPSDARLQAAAAANGSTSYNPKALQEVTKFNDATTTAVEKYRQGVDRAVGFRNNDVNALPEFKSAWAKNLDPNVYRVENAVRDHDTMELQRLKSELGPEGLKKLAEKRKNLEALSTTGRLPQ